MTRRALFERWKPGSTEELLLKASLLQGEIALDAWRHWHQAADLTAELDSVSGRFFWLLPRLYRSLENHGIADPDLDKLKGIYRHTWSKNQLIGGEVSSVLRQLQDAAIPHMVIGNMSLLAHYADDLGLSPLGIPEIAVPLKLHWTALEVLSKLGWIAVARVPASRLPLLRGLKLHNAKGSPLELRWHIFPQCCWTEADSPLWQRGVPFLLNGISTLAPDPADLLLQIIAEAAWRGEDQNGVWIARAVTLLQAAGQAIDWTYFCGEAARHGLARASYTALSYLNNAAFHLIPKPILDELENAARGVEDCVYTVPHSRPFSRVRSLWRGYSRYAHAATLPRKVIGFPAYLQAWWGLTSRCHIPIYVLRSGIRRATGRMR